MAWIDLFSVTFLLGLGGAISPGALLSFTIYRAVKSGKKSYKYGLAISFGHIVIEILLIMLLLFGLASIIKYPLILLIIGILGGVLLLYFGSIILVELKNKKIDTSFLKTNLNEVKEDLGLTDVPQDKKLTDISEEHPSKSLIDVSEESNHGIMRSFFSSIGFLMSNPYWWLWWATIGVEIMIENQVSFANWNYLLVFIVAKELGALLWYTSVAVAVGFSRRLMTPTIYLGILGICGLFMAGYGIYLCISTILSFI